MGIADVPRDQWHAFVYLDGEGMLDLNRLIAGGLPEGWTLVSAMGINNKGQIVGMAGVSPAIGGGSWVGSYERAFLLTPVPEPALAVAPFAALVLAGRRIGRRARAPRSAAEDIQSADGGRSGLTSRGNALFLQPRPSRTSARTELYSKSLRVP